MKSLAKYSIKYIMAKSQTKGGRRSKGKKITSKKTNKPTWIKFVTNYHHQQSKKNKIKIFVIYVNN